MLVLTRKAKQSIMIGDEIEVTVLSNDGTKVRLGIQAPLSVPVHRTEIYLEIQDHGRDSAGSDARDDADSHARDDLKRASVGRQRL